MQPLLNSERFTVAVEVVPPKGPDPEPLLSALEAVSNLPFDSFSVATNPVAKARMSSLALGFLLQQRTGRPATVHCITRDHNRLSIQALLWGARALGVRSVLVATGDLVALDDGTRTTTVRDMDVYRLVRMAREANLHTSVVLDPHLGSDRALVEQVRRLERKIKAGAQGVVTQPVYDRAGAQTLRDATQHLDLPVSLGILPLRSARHARFLHDQVAGITVPEAVQARMERAADPVAAGIAGARDMLAVARQWFAGACIMPPFDHFEILSGILDR